MEYLLENYSSGTSHFYLKIETNNDTYGLSIQSKIEGKWLV